MRQAARLIAVVTILTLGIIPHTVVASQAQDSKPKNTESENKKKPEGASLTGCVDEQDGKYVLVDDHDLRVVANLDAQGFPTEGFAKHVGHKVTVRGTNNPSGARPVFKVRSIETISETCAPQATQRKEK